MRGTREGCVCAFNELTCHQHQLLVWVECSGCLVEAELRDVVALDIPPSSCIPSACKGVACVRFALGMVQPTVCSPSNQLLMHRGIHPPRACYCSTWHERLHPAAAYTASCL
jgi:hypothetical protein